LAILVAMVAAVAAPKSAIAYTFGAGIQAGAEEKVFDWSTSACEDTDIPDSPARAFRDASGQVQLIATHYIGRRWLGFDLNGVQHRCEVLLNSAYDPNPAAYNDKQWIASTYTLDGVTVHALIHQEYQGSTHPNQCDPSSAAIKCRFFNIAYAKSTDWGVTYKRRAAPSDLVATLPYTYSTMLNNGPGGIRQPSNIVYRPDGYYYVMVAADAQGAQQGGTCLMRTHTLGDPSSWRAWDGSSFTVRFIDPYVETAEPPEAHVCAPVAPAEIGVMPESLTYNTYFGKYLLIGSDSTRSPKGFYYSLSSDLIHWSPRTLFMQAELPWRYTCGTPDPVFQPSLLFPGSPARNLNTTSQNNYLYFTRINIYYNSTACWQPLDRDLIRIPIRFTSGQGPAAEPNCSVVKASPNRIRSPNNRWVPVKLSDPAHSLIIEVYSVVQDEPVNGIATARYGTVPDQVRVRAAARPDGDGRVYRIAFTGTGRNNTCWGTATVGVSRNGRAVDTPGAYNALTPPP
jgi:hypothetical protein